MVEPLQSWILLLLYLVLSQVTQALYNHERQLPAWSCYPLVNHHYPGLSAYWRRVSTAEVLEFGRFSFMLWLYWHLLSQVCDNLDFFLRTYYECPGILLVWNCSYLYVRKRCSSDSVQSLPTGGSKRMRQLCWPALGWLIRKRLLSIVTQTVSRGLTGRGWARF